MGWVGDIVRILAAYFRCRLSSLTYMWKIPISASSAGIGVGLKAWAILRTGGFCMFWRVLHCTFWFIHQTSTPKLLTVVTHVMYNCQRCFWLSSFSLLASLVMVMKALMAAAVLVLMWVLKL